MPAIVRRGIGQTDPAGVGPRDWQVICLTFHGEDGGVIAGPYGATMWVWLMIEGSWVATDRRGQGLGRWLLLTAANIAIERDCVGASLGTFDFGAKTFYERHGYSVFAELAGFPPGHSHFHLQKRFAAPPGDA